MLAPDNDAIRLYDRLYTLARYYYKCSPDLAEDAAADAIASGLDSGSLNYSYCRASVRNYLFEYYRNRRIRNEDYRTPIGQDGLPQDFPESRQPANQDLRLVAQECVNAIENLPPDIRAVMRYAAREYEIPEIAKILNISTAVANGRIKYGRRLLRERDGYEIERKRGHHKYIGIRKRHQKWQAAVQQGESYYYLGHFDTASEAAKAYDAKAKEIFGENAKVNFLPPSTSRDAGSAER